MSQGTMRPRQQHHRPMGKSRLPDATVAASREPVFSHRRPAVRHVLAAHRRSGAILCGCSARVRAAPRRPRHACHEAIGQPAWLALMNRNIRMVSCRCLGKTRTRLLTRCRARAEADAPHAEAGPVPPARLRPNLRRSERISPPAGPPADRTTRPRSGSPERRVRSREPNRPGHARLDHLAPKFRRTGRMGCGIWTPHAKASAVSTETG